MLKSLLLIFLGGGLGSICRYGLSVALSPPVGRFPWPTLLANGIACLIAGVFIGLSLNGQLGDQRKLFVMTGFCGGFSTFSTFSVETVQLWSSGNTSLAILNMISNFAVCTIAVSVGILLSKP